MLLVYNGLGLSCCARLGITSCQHDFVASDVSTEEKKKPDANCEGDRGGERVGAIEVFEMHPSAGY